MDIIYKYNLSKWDSGTIEVEIPKGAKILTMKLQGSQPVLWALVSVPKNPEYKPANETRMFKVIATGQEIELGCNERLDYIGTFQHNGFVGHVFEYKKL